MKSALMLSAGNLLALLLLAGYVFQQPKTGQKGFILNQEVFKRFVGTRVLEQKLALARQQHKSALDSLATLPFINPAQRETKLAETRQQYALQEQALSDQYTAQLWQEINRHAAAFGRQKGYDFLFGATGNGNLMFADDSHNVTEEFITYLNDKYEGR